MDFVLCLWQGFVHVVSQEPARGKMIHNAILNTCFISDKLCAAQWNKKQNKLKIYRTEWGNNVHEIHEQSDYVNETMKDLILIDLACIIFISRCCGVEELVMTWNEKSPGEKESHCVLIFLDVFSYHAWMIEMIEIKWQSKDELKKETKCLKVL